MALYGDLGSGKTTFTKAFARYLGVTEEITSPTFVILKEYRSKRSRIKRLVHVDCYRFDSVEDSESVGLLEYFEENEGIIVIEWPEKIETTLPERTKKIYFSYVDETTRQIMIK